MPVDPWATTVAQSFPPQSPPGWASLAERLAAQKREMFDLRASVLANVSDVVADLAAKQATLTAQNAFLISQSLGFASTKGWSTSTISGTGAYEILAYDPTYDDQYTFQASSTGVLEIMLSARVMLCNDSATIAATSRGYSLSWAGGSLPWSDERSSTIRGYGGPNTISGSNVSIVTVPSNAVVTMQTVRAKFSPVAPDWAEHGIVTTTVVVTRVGI